MASEYTTIIRLEPFLQRFLRAQFPDNTTDVFYFPAKHDFNRLLGYLVQACPKDYRIPDYGESTFRIGLPYMDHKNVAIYNYLSEKGQITFSNSIKRFMYMLFHDELTEAIFELNLTRLEAIDHLMDDFGFIADDYDRLQKDYQRWINKERLRRHRKNKRHKNNTVY